VSELTAPSDESETEGDETQQKETSMMDEDVTSVTLREDSEGGLTEENVFGPAEDNSAWYAAVLAMGGIR